MSCIWPLLLCMSAYAVVNRRDAPSSSSSPLQMNGTQHPAPSTLTTLPQVLSALSSLESEEAELSNSLSALLADQQPILASLARLQSLLPRIDELHAEASTLSRKVSVTARTAERVGGRVRTLDEEMRRVREASDRVHQVMELKVRSLSLLLSFASLFLTVGFVRFGRGRPFSHIRVRLRRPLVIIVRPSVVRQRTRLGVGNTTLCASHGPPQRRDQWYFRRDGCRKISRSFSCSVFSDALKSYSLLLRILCLLHRHYRTRERTSFRYSRLSLRKRPRFGTR